MILKQRFADGRTNYIDLGDSFTYIQPIAEEFNRYADVHKLNAKEREDCAGFVCNGQNEVPIFNDFPQWIYSNDGQLFMKLA